MFGISNSERPCPQSKVPSSPPSIENPTLLARRKFAPSSNDDVIQNPSQGEATKFINGNHIALRSTPSPKAQIIDRLDKGKEVFLLDSDGQWSHVRDTLIDASDRIMPVETPALQVAAAEKGYRYRRLIADEVYDGPFLENAKDLLRYGNSVLSLGDRLRVMGVLEQEGSLTVKDCLAIFTETKPIAGLAQLILHGFVKLTWTANCSARSRRCEGCLNRL